MRDFLFKSESNRQKAKIFKNFFLYLRGKRNQGPRMKNKTKRLIKAMHLSHRHTKELKDILKPFEQGPYPWPLLSRYRQTEIAHRVRLADLLVKDICPMQTSKKGGVGSNLKHYAFLKSQESF